MHIHLINVNHVGLLISPIQTMHQHLTKAKRKAAFKKVAKALTAMEITNHGCSYIGSGLDSMGNPILIIGEETRPPKGKKNASR